MASLYMNRVVEVVVSDYDDLRIRENESHYTSLLVTPYRHGDPKHLFHFADQLERAAYQLKQRARDKMAT